MAARGTTDAPPAPRRQPKRESAEQIVDAILRAASLLLVRDGVEGLTTNAIARVAGVSVGSLYQYFPDKHAIVAEMARQIETTALAMVAEESARIFALSAREATARVTHLSLTPSFGSNDVRRALLREVPRSWTLEDSRKTDSTVVDAIGMFFSTRPGQLRPLRSMPHAMFVVMHAVEGASESVLLAFPAALRDAPVQRELFYLGWSYVAPAKSEITLPDFDRTDLPPLVDEPDQETAHRLLDEPSHRRTSHVPPEPITDRARATRQKIVEAAERVLARDGFEGLTVRAIAREAGLANGALYHHFPNAQAVAGDVAKQLELRMGRELEYRLTASSTVDDIARALAGAYTEQALADDSLRRILLREVPRRWTEEATIGLGATAVHHLVEAFGRASDLRRGDHALMAFFALHAVRAVAETFLLLEPPDFARPELYEELRDLVMCYLEAR